MATLGFKKPHEVRHFTDLSRGQKDYLKRQGVSEHDFDRLDAKAKREWIEETHENYYESSLDLK